MSDPSFADKVIVLTGASSGIGKGAARRWAAGGASLVLAARRGGLLEELAAECREAGGRAEAVPTDVGDAEQVERLADRAVAAFGRIDVWVNNAGVGAVGRFDETPPEVNAGVIRTNVLGTLHGSHAALRRFRTQDSGGTLINVASALGKIPGPYYAAYVASKHAVVGLGDALRQELAQEGVENVRVCTVMPMAMDTPFFAHAANYTGRRAVPIPPVYDARETVDALVRLSAEPEDEVIVGTAGKLSNIAHHLLPDAVETFMGANVEQAQMRNPPPAGHTAGSVLEPVPTGTDVGGGWLDEEK